MFWTALFTHPFLQMALFAGLLASLSAGVIGSYVVVRRIAFIAGSIAHSILGGMGLFLWLQRTQGVTWLDPIKGAFCAAIGSALLLGWVQRRFRQREDALIAAIWSIGMAIGVVFISITPGSTGDLLNFLFGNILWVSRSDLVALGVLAIAIIGLAAIYYKPLLAMCFDEEQAALQGVRVQRLELMLLCLVAVAIVLLIQIIGTILVLALLTIPATLAALFTSRLWTMMTFACVLSALSTLLGFWGSYQLNWPPGATIALVAAAGYLVTLVLRKRIF